MHTREERSVVALIPARAGSKRIPDKNVRSLAGHPLIAYTIASALEAGIFSDVIVSTESERYAQVARELGAEVPFLRPPEYSDDDSPDIHWVEHALTELRQSSRDYQCFSILRPTSPFRTADTILRAWRQFLSDPQADSLRAVERSRQHPGKMWVIRESRMLPLLPFDQAGVPWHSSPYQSLPEIYAQNASLEIARSRVVFDTGSISGNVISPFVSQGLEGFDLNDEQDWETAEQLIRAGRVRLPSVGEKNES